MQVFAPGFNGTGAIWNDSYPVSGGFNGWGGWKNMGSITVHFGIPTAMVYKNQIEVFAVAGDGYIWNSSYASGCGANGGYGWCAPWRMSLGSLATVSPDSGIAAMVWGDTIQLFAVGSDGLMQSYSYTGTCTSGLNGWCAPWAMPVGSLPKLSTSSGVAVMPWNNNKTIQLFAIGSDGLMQAYSYTGSCTSGLNGWCAPWAMPVGSLSKLGTSSGVAVMPWNNNTTIQLFGIGSDGLMQSYSYTGTCTSGLNGWCAPWAMPVSSLPRLSPSSGVAVLPWNNNSTIQLFAVGSNGLMQSYSYTGTCTSGLNGWCAPWSMPEGTLPTLNIASGVAVIPWGNTMQLYAVGPGWGSPNVQSFSYTGSCTSGLNGWCAPWQM
jgi:hypothetical protein